MPLNLAKLRMRQCCSCYIVKIERNDVSNGNNKEWMDMGKWTTGLQGRAAYNNTKLYKGNQVEDIHVLVCWWNPWTQAITLASKL